MHNFKLKKRQFRRTQHPGAPHRCCNDGERWGTDRGSYFMSKKYPNFRIRLPKKIPTFLTVLKNSDTGSKHVLMLLLI